MKGWGHVQFPAADPSHWSSQPHQTEVGLGGQRTREFSGV